MKFFNKFFDRSSKALKNTEKQFKDFKLMDLEYESKSFEEMKLRLDEIKLDFKKIVKTIPLDQMISVRRFDRRAEYPEHEKLIHEKLMQVLPEVYAIINQSFKRISGSGYHDVQIKAAMVLAKGQVLVEQYTGEGKTRTFILPMALYSLVGRGAHLVTVNSYLTKVGGEYAGHFLNPLGISVGIVAPDDETLKYISNDDVKVYKGEEAFEMSKKQSIDIDKMNGVNTISITKSEAYSCDITYGTNNEFGFDYLRDNMSWDLNRIVQRELYFCIIDEADSILIDEARTPLIISSTPSETDTEKYTTYANAVSNLEEKTDYEVDYKSRSVNLTEDGMNKVEKLLGIDNIWKDFGSAFYVENALKAKVLFEKNDKYVVKNGEVLIVDEFTGRTLQGRRYSEGLHQAIEAKEGVQINQESKTFATITFQNFFRLYKVICGGSGSVITESEEFFKIYGLDSFVIPTNKPRARIDYSDLVFKDQNSKFNAVINDVKESHKKGRPVLIGTTSVEKSETVSRLLDKEGIPHQVLNAKFHEQESRIVADAGKKGAVTVATNMAGRGTDIVIGGGRRGDEAYLEIAILGGLHVIGTERHDSRRIDNQLRGRTGRQGEPGSTRFYSALDDQILRIMGGETISKLLEMVNVPDNQPIPNPFISKQIESAQKRVEGINFDYRKSIVEYDDVMNQHREIFYSRRRRIVETSENSIGKIKIGYRILDLNLPENQDRLPEHKELIESQRVSLESFFKSVINRDSVNLIIENITKADLKNKASVEDLVEKLTKYLGVDTFASIFELKVGEIVEKLPLLIQKEKDNLNDFLDKRLLSIFDNKQKELGENFYYVTKMISLESMDRLWVEHLELMKGVRDSVRLQTYAQKNPLLEYQNIAFDVFSSLISSINIEITKNFFNLKQKFKDENASQSIKLVTNEDSITDILDEDREVLLTNNYEKKIDMNEVNKKMSKIQEQIKKQYSNLNTNSGETKKRGVKSLGNLEKRYGRNDKVSVRYSDGREEKDVKYKKVELDIQKGLAVII